MNTLINLVGLIVSSLKSITTNQDLKLSLPFLLFVVVTVFKIQFYMMYVQMTAT